MQELHFWGFTLQMELRRSGWLLQTLYLLSGHKTPEPLVMEIVVPQTHHAGKAQNPLQNISL